ncbi:hypothetical protein AAG906_025309 [Vitis piasezkii]
MCYEALQDSRKGTGKSPSTNYDIRVNGIAKEHEPLFKLGEKWDIAMATVYLASKSLSM